MRTGAGSVMDVGPPGRARRGRILRGCRGCAPAKGRGLAPPRWPWKDHVMQRAGYVVAMYGSIRQRATFVRATVVEGEDGVIEGPEDRDAAAGVLRRARRARECRSGRPRRASPPSSCSSRDLHAGMGRGRAPDIRPKEARRRPGGVRKGPAPIGAKRLLRGGAYPRGAGVRMREARTGHSAARMVRSASGVNSWACPPSARSAQGSI